jgi:DNA-binding MarR family transcriptional regulator
MKLEDEILQSRFEDEHQKALLNILVTAGFIETIISNALKPFGISSQQYNVLRILKGQYPKPATLGVVQERMHDKMSNASRLVDKLVEKGMVVRNQCCHNRRQVDILINQKGLALLEETEAPMREMGRILKKISAEEASGLSDILEKVRA